MLRSEAAEIAGFGVRQQYRQRMIVPENHALSPKAYKKCEPIFSGKMQKVSDDVPSYPDPQ